LLFKSQKTGIGMLKQNVVAYFGFTGFQQQINNTSEPIDSIIAIPVHLFLPE
jgi:hypothetical protein